MTRPQSHRKSAVGGRKGNQTGPPRSPLVLSPLCHSPALDVGAAGQETARAPMCGARQAGMVQTSPSCTG